MTHPDALAATLGLGAAEGLLCPLLRAFSIPGWGWGVSVGPSMWLQFSLDSGIPEILKEWAISFSGQRKWVAIQLNRFHA